LLHALSFADVLDEDTGRGYQRRFNAHHSLDFRRYIQREGSSTIPLTFNVRPRPDDGWRLEKQEEGKACLIIEPSAGKVLAQVDCQHRLGYLNDLSISLPFMTFIGLSEAEEMEVFGIINSKAKGLSTSLLDFHEATLARDLAYERPELFVTLQLNNNADSPWYKQLDLGGNKTSGLSRRASLRTMQKAVKRFLTTSRIMRTRGPIVAAQIVLDFWSATAFVLADIWDQPRQHLVTKGVGVYTLMLLAADLYQEAGEAAPCDKKYFAAALADVLPDVDWRNDGDLRGLGGESGVQSAIAHIRELRSRRNLKLVVNA
jgi:DGQHR domain-containing protein